mmetsp:Transcript_17468/g.48229  ORF Transcript_17468/g.48229 Transcript_17468/m.48229 type:complete len:706 (+) Transcript_17468:779-2896(+)
MTKQILLKTPRGNTAVIPVDHFVAKARASAVMARCRGSSSCSSSPSPLSVEPTLALSSGEEENAVSFSYHSTTRETPLFSLEEDADAAAIASAVDTSRIFENHNPNENGNSNGNDVVDVNVDDHHCCDPDRQSKEELLFHLIGASKRRDVGRKRNLRSVCNLEVEGEDENEDDGMEVDTGIGIGIGTDTDSGMEIDRDSSDDQSSHSLSGSRSGADDPEQKAVAHRFDEMTIHRDRHCRSSSSSSNRFKSRRKFYSHSSARSATAFGAAEATSTSTSTSTSAATCTSTCTSASTCASTCASTSTTTRRRQRYEPTLSRLCHDQQPPPPQGRLSGTAMVNDAPACVSASASSPPPLMVAFYHQGRQVSLDRIWDWITQSPASTNPVSDTANASSSSSPSATNRTITEQSSSTAPQFPLYLTLSTSVRLLGGIDRQNRVGSKFGGGGVSSSQNAERERKERLKQLALESIDLAKDPYLMRNHLGTYECKLCLTLHTNEANYLAHTQGKKHQSGLAKRAHMEKVRKEREEQLADRNQLKRPPPGGRFVCPPATKVPKIGRPAYQVFKSKDPETSQRCLTFELTYKDIRKDLQPRHRFMSAFEQRVDLPRDKRYQYVLFAAEPYETIAFKIPNEPLDRDPGRLITHWDEDDKKFTVTLYFEDGTNGGNESGSGNGKEETKEEGDAVVGMDTDGGTGTASAFAPALLGGR